MSFQYLRSALNSKAITKYYDFNLQSGYKPSRMQNGLTTSRGGVLYVSSMILVGNGRRYRTENKQAASYGDVNHHIAKQHPLLKCTTDYFFFFNTE